MTACLVGLAALGHAQSRSAIRVVCVGDSNTVGKRAVSGNDYPAVPLAASLLVLLRGGGGGGELGLHVARA